MNNVEEMTYKICFSKECKEVHLLGYEERDTQHVFGSRVGKKWEKQEI